MTERLLTFTDLDENPLVVRLKQDRIELVVFDSRPELEAGELRAFASALFAEYVGPHLVTRLTTARARLIAARELHPADARTSELAGALDGALRALDDVTHVMSSAGTIDAPPPPAVPLARAELPAYPPLRTRRARRCEEPGARCGWGWRAGYEPASSISM